MNQTRGTLKTLTGTVVSSKMDKSIVVKVSKRFKHPKYGKFVTDSKKYYAHDKDNSAGIGDEVLIAACKPMSKTKKWRLVKITRKAVEL
jgi:small subunit ribosomal protein S17